MQINNVKIVHHLPAEVKFKTVDRPISFKGRMYQLYVGEKHTSFSKRLHSFLKASFWTVATGFMGLYFKSVRKEWGRVFHSTRTIKRYVPVNLFITNHLIRNAVPSFQRKFFFNGEWFDARGFSQITSESIKQARMDRLIYFGKAVKAS